MIPLLLSCMFMFDDHEVIHNRRRSYLCVHVCTQRGTQLCICHSLRSMKRFINLWVMHLNSTHPRTHTHTHTHTNTHTCTAQPGSICIWCTLREQRSHSSCRLRVRRHSSAETCARDTPPSTLHPQPAFCPSLSLPLPPSLPPSLPMPLHRLITHTHDLKIQ